MNNLEIVRVDLAERGYDIVIGRSLIGEAAAFVSPVLRGGRVIMVADETVAAIYLGPLEAALRAADIRTDRVILPAGEQTKDFEHLISLLDDLLAARVDRNSTVIALGGGVIGDLAGFAAAVALRGIDLIQVPTTLLAQIDSSVGGKTGINTGFGKNLVGSFHQPRLVLVDTTTLDSLPHRELLAGYAEMVKYGLIDDEAFFSWLEENAPAILGDTPETAAARRRAVATCCRAKARIVAADEREGGRRALLNLGHTFGHALEAVAAFTGALLHGEAVAIGTIMAFDLSVRLGLCPAEDSARVRAHFDAVGLPTSPPRLHDRSWNAGDLLNHMSRDKKVRDGRPTLVLSRGIGHAFLFRDATDQDILPVLDAAVAA